MNESDTPVPEAATVQPSLSEIELWLRRRDLAPRLRERLAMVKAQTRGQSIGAIAAWSGRSTRRVRHWLAQYQAGGVAALGDAPRSGRPSKADATYRQELATAVETPPRDLALPFDVWTSARLSAYLAERTAIRIAPGWLRALLAHDRFVSGRPKHTLKHLQDADAVAACTAELTAVGEKGGRRARPLRTAL
jgi:transposase